MTSITVRGPVVELDGDELTRLMWELIKNEIIFPHLQIPVHHYFDLGIANQDATDFQVVDDAGQAVLSAGVGIKCAGITANAARVEEFGLKKAWPSPNGRLRAILGGTILREPIIVPGVKPLVRTWSNNKIIVARLSEGDIYGCLQGTVPPGGRVRLVIEDAQGKDITDGELVRTFDGSAGVFCLPYNTEVAVANYARACFAHALNVSFNVVLSHKDTILKVYDSMIIRVFKGIFETEYKDAFEEAGLSYRDGLIDGVVMEALRTTENLLWVCKNYDGDVQSDLVAQGFGSPGLMMSNTVTPCGKIMLADAAHGTVTAMWRNHQSGGTTSANPMATIAAWTAGLRHRAMLDEHPELARFCDVVDKAMLDVVQAGTMSEDLAAVVEGEVTPVTTEAFISAIAAEVTTQLAA